MHNCIPDPLAADKKLLDMLPVAIVIVDDNATGYYMNTKAARIFFPASTGNDLKASIKLFNLTRLSADFSAEKFGYARGWLNQHDSYQADLSFELRREKACYKINIVPYILSDEHFPPLYLITFETSSGSSSKNNSLNQSFRELKQFSRLSAMREISTSMADSLNQPLTAIMSYTQAMQRMYLTESDSKEIEAAMERVVINAQHAAQIIKDIRSRTLTTVVNFDYVDLNQLIMDTIALTELNTPASEINLQLHFDHNIPAIKIIRIQIKQVILSLLTNAIEAFSGMGLQQSKITIETKLSAEDLLMTICDNGPGISDQVKDKLFEPFISTKKEGIGIGLSMSQYIIELHNGKITLDANHKSDNTKKPGTCVRICLPLYRK